MAINLISPGIKITEAEQLPASSALTGSTNAAIVGRFRWGQIGVPTYLTNEAELLENFGRPTQNTSFSIDFLGASNYLNYSPSLYVVRVESANVKNSTAEATTGSNTSGTGLLIKTDDAWIQNYANGAGNVGPWAAKYAGEIGNSIKVSTCASANAWESTLTGTWTVTAGSTSLSSANGSADTEVSNGDLLVISGRTIKVSSVTNANTIVLQDAHLTGATGVTVTRRWEYFGSFDSAPGTSSWVSVRGGSNDEMHIAVVDENGVITGVAGTLLEKFQEVSKASDAKSDTGSATYYKDVIANSSKYIRWMDHDFLGSNFGNTSTSTTFTAPNKPLNYSLAGGSDGDVPLDSNKLTAYTTLQNTSEVLIDLIPMGNANANLINQVINDVANVRKDVIILVSPEQSDVVNQAGSEISNVLGFADGITKSSYVFMDCNWKYTYDKYNDVYTYVPCNYDIAGIMARNDVIRNPWNSPAGYTVGAIRNVVKLAWNPNNAQRDSLYKESINPVFSQTGRGSVLFGDKTFIKKNSSFNRINVRRLFIELQKTIGEFSGDILFGENTVATRTQFVNTVEPYLRNVQARGGISEFLVVCDETNNPESVVSANEFVCDIYVRPVSSVNFIQLNFTSVRGSISFTEV